MRCSTCQADNPAGGKFCDQCGSPLVAVCPACGAAARPGKPFCGQCGEQLGRDASARTPAESAAMDRSAEPLRSNGPVAELGANPLIVRARDVIESAIPGPVLERRP